MYCLTATWTKTRKLIVYEIVRNKTNVDDWLGIGAPARQYRVAVWSDSGSAESPA